MTHTKGERAAQPKTEQAIKKAAKCEHKKTKGYDGLYYCEKCGGPLHRDS